MTNEPTVLQELTMLQLTRPGPGASSAAIADWHERRAAMLEHVAAAGGPEAGRAHESARRAHRRALELAA